MAEIYKNKIPEVKNQDGENPEDFLTVEKNKKLLSIEKSIGFLNIKNITKNELEKEIVKFTTEQKITIEKISNIKSQILVNNNTKLINWDKIFSEILDDLWYKYTTLNEVIDSEKELNTFVWKLKKKKTLDKTEKEYLKVLEPLQISYKKSTKVWIDLNKNNIKEIIEEKTNIKGEKYDKIVRKKERIKYEKEIKEEQKHDNTSDEEKLVDTSIIDENPIKKEVNKNTLTKDNWEEIVITKDEAKIAEQSPKAKENILKMESDLNKLWLKFVWKYRNELIQIMKNTNIFKWKNIDNNDSDLINNVELNLLIQFILFSVWESFSTKYESNYKKILIINEVWSIWSKKSKSWGISNIWIKFSELWFINTDWNLEPDWEEKLILNLKNKKDI